MKRLLLVAAIAMVVALIGGQAGAYTVFADNLDSAASFTANWSNVYGGTDAITWDSTKDAIGAAGSGSAKSTLSKSRIYHNLGTNLTGNFTASWYVFDDSMSRAFGEMESHANGVYTGSLQQIFAAGKYNSVTMTGETWDSTKYQARVLYGATGQTGWFNLNAPGAVSRSAGWHKFTVERLADKTTLNFYVDDVLGRTITGAAVWDINVGVLGFGTTSTSNGNAWFDGFNVVAPEPGSMLALGMGLVGLLGFVRRRTA